MCGPMVEALPLSIQSFGANSNFQWSNKICEARVTESKRGVTDDSVVVKNINSYNSHANKYERMCALSSFASHRNESNSWE